MPKYIYSPQVVCGYRNAIRRMDNGNDNRNQTRDVGLFIELAERMAQRQISNVMRRGVFSR